ncbi:hypothetical protein [Corynebacterium sp. UBA2622]|uniref:hypothetical protein n=1 Tax=Corynebacterium sp. UBA2622 TaxID=1946393 RepID=UPI0025BEF30A|nr:hypothetical protein [Corynebacterium sp. UBA2622]
MNSTLARAKNALITFPQAYAPGLAGAVVRRLTGGKKDSATRKAPAGEGQLERYAPGGDGRVNGIRAAQAAAAAVPPTTGREA